MLMRLIIWCLFITCGFYNFSTMAQEPLGQILDFEDAELIHRSNPQYPAHAAKNKQEGWVDVSFVISKEGKVIEPQVVNSSGLVAFEKAALKAVRKWEYEPARENGQPIEQTKNNVVFDFLLTGFKQQVTKKFYKRYKRVIKSIESSEFDMAAEKLTEIKNAAKWNMYENVLTYEAMFQLGLAKKDNAMMYKALRKVTVSDSHEKYVAPNVFLERLRSRFLLAIQMENYHDAINTFARIKERSEATEILNELHPIFQSLESYIKGNESLISHGEIKQQRPYSQKLLRRQFAIHNIEGEINFLDIRCDSKRVTYVNFTTDNFITMPDSWGECSILVEGNPDTTFEVIERT